LDWGYIGLMLASRGVEVIGTDYNEEPVAALKAGKTTFKEECLDELYRDSAGMENFTDIVK